MKDSSRVITNTIILYAKVIITSLIGFFTTRFVLENLGAEDYGINNVVAGVVAMLSFMSISMTTSTLRFNAYYLGKDNDEKQRSVFNTSIVVHFIIGLVIVLLLETFGVFFLEDVLNIPPTRLDVAKYIFQFVTFSMFITVMSVPYDAVINAHENMLLFSIISIFEAIIKFSLAIALFYVNIDKLVFYSVGISLVPLLVLLIKHIACKRRYQEVKLELSLCSKPLIKEMFGFTFWNMFGAFSNTCKNQGVSMVLNVFFGVVINAAYGIAHQVNSMLSYITGSLQKSLNPLIMKSEGAGNRQRALSLAYTQSKYSFLLLSIMVLPIFGSLEYLLGLWLKDVPDHTLMFCKLILLYNMLCMLTTGLQVAIQAHGKIKQYQLTVSSIILLNLPIAYILLKCGLPAESVVGSFIIVEIILIITRVSFAHKLIEMPIKDYYRHVLFPLRYLIIAVPLVALIDFFVPSTSFWGFLLVFIVKFIITAIAIYYLSCEKDERQIVNEKVKIMMAKVFKKKH